VLAVVQFALTGLSVFGPIYMQELLHYGPIGAGLTLLPLTVPLLLLAPRAGALYDRVGPRRLVAVGCALTGASLLWCAAKLGALDYAWLVPAFVCSGAGLAFVMTPASTDAMNAAAPSLRGQASGVIHALRQVGGTVGLAIMGSAAAAVQASHLTDYGRRVGATALDRARFETIVASAHGDPAVLHRLSAPTLLALRNSLTAGIGVAYYIGGAVVLCGSILAWALLRREPAADAPEASGTPAGAGRIPALAGVAEPRR
jgi:MFS family permease